ncbi:MAG: hypothetical protein MUE60_01970 [Candidatus Eisenbacteria bacterium]|jgi:hypothetical protein|nr:hypothetical protein [Candidatus Eisenbacteria bacterium]
MPGPLSGARLSLEERKTIQRCPHFVPRWANHPVLATSPVKEVIEECLLAPESVFIEMAWNRIVIRNFRLKICDLFYPPDGREPLADPLFVAGYRNMIGSFLSGFSRALVHAAGVALDSRAAVFLGPDDAGKTTVARSATLRPVLSDDHLLITHDGGQSMAHATPFGNLTAGPNSARVGAFFVLEKSSAFEIEPMRQAEFFEFLWEQAGHTKYTLPREDAVAHLDLLRAISRSAPVFRMRFERNFINWDAIDSAMLKGA